MKIRPFVSFFQTACQVTLGEKARFFIRYAQSNLLLTSLHYCSGSVTTITGNQQRSRTVFG